MPDTFFYLFAAAALVSGALVVLKKDPLISAVFLIVTLCNIAGIYLYFGAGFLAAVQIIVYAGAVMMLFLFIVMLLPAGGGDETQTEGLKKGVVAAALFFGAELLLIILGAAQTLTGTDSGQVSTEHISVGVIGELLFSRYLIPLELVSFLLLVAVIGVVMLTGRGRRQEGAQ